MKESKRNAVSVVIVNYNTCDILRDSLVNLRKNQLSLQTIVVDNNSSDGSQNMVTTEFSDVSLISLNKNAGLASGNNVGLKESKGKYVLFMGSDAFPQVRAIDTLIHFMENNSDVGIAVGEVRLRSGLLDSDTHRGFPTPWVAFTHLSGMDKIFPKSKLFGRYYMQYEDFYRSHEIDLCTSHFMFTRRKMFEDIGLWDEDYFVFGEDVDLCWRAKKNGWKIMYVPEAKIIHYKGASVGIRKETQDITQASRETKKKMLLETTEAMLRFYRKHFGESGTNLFVIMGIIVLAKLRSIKILFNYHE